MTPNCPARNLVLRPHRLWKCKGNVRDVSVGRIPYRAAKPSPAHYSFSAVLNNAALGNAIPWFRRLFAGLSMSGSGFDPRLVHVIFVVDNVALGQGLAESFGFLLSLSLHQCSILFHLSPTLYNQWEGSSNSILKKNNLTLCHPLSTPIVHFLP